MILADTARGILIGIAPPLKIPSGLPLKTVKQRNRRQFIQKYQNLVCFSLLETA